MTPLFKKLNFKDHASVLVLDLPDELREACASQSEFTSMVYNQSELQGTSFAMAFVRTLEGVEEAVNALLPILEGDAVLWMCYPKGSSKRYSCTFNRDTGWSSLGKAGMEPVRQVSVNDDWSALRFRKSTYIKNMTRSTEMAISDEGRERTSIQPKKRQRR
ncbi:MAG: hypothetical protein ACFCUH_02470 [Flavobacteriales bacterium]